MHIYIPPNGNNIAQKTYILLQEIFLSHETNINDCPELFTNMLSLNTKKLPYDFVLTVEGDGEEYYECKLPINISQFLFKLEFFSDNEEAKQLYTQIINERNYMCSADFEKELDIVADQRNGFATSAHTISRVVDLPLFNKLSLELHKEIYNTGTLRQNNLLEVCDELLTHAKLYANNPNHLNTLAEFWNENSHFFSENLYTEKDFQHHSPTQPDGNYRFKDNIGFSYHFYLEYIQQIQHEIAKIFYFDFIKNPEFQPTFSQKMPEFFQFTNWLSSEKYEQQNHVYKTLNSFLTPEHINILSQYKNTTGFDFYIKNLLSINDIDTIKPLLFRLPNLNQLFEKNSVGLPTSAVAYLEERIKELDTSNPIQLQKHNQLIPEFLTVHLNNNLRVSNTPIKKHKI